MKTQTSVTLAIYVCGLVIAPMMATSQTKTTVSPPPVATQPANPNSNPLNPNQPFQPRPAPQAGIPVTPDMTNLIAPPGARSTPRAWSNLPNGFSGTNRVPGMTNALPPDWTNRAPSFTNRTPWSTNRTPWNTNLPRWMTNRPPPKVKTLSQQ